MPLRTNDTEYGAEYWGSLDGGRGYADSTMWQDISHAVAEVTFFDKVAGKDRALEHTMVDVGCAYGFLVRHMNNRGCKTWGLDFSKYALSQAPPDVKTFVKWADITKPDMLPFGVNTFDIATSFETLEHLPAENALQAVQHLWNLLKHGGLLIATICVVGQPDTRSDPTHVTVVPREWWEQKFEEIGFTREREKEAQLRFFWLFSMHQGVFVYRKQ